jgi:hypothetical protein
MSLLGVQGFAITRIEHTGKAKAAALPAKRGAPVASDVELGDGE